MPTKSHPLLYQPRNGLQKRYPRAPVDFTGMPVRKGIEPWVPEELLSRRPLLRIDLQHVFDNFPIIVMDLEHLFHKWRCYGFASGRPRWVVCEGFDLDLPLFRGPLKEWFREWGKSMNPADVVVNALLIKSPSTGGWSEHPDLRSHE